MYTRNSHYELNIKRRSLLILFLLILLAACTGGQVITQVTEIQLDNAPAAIPWPTDGWLSSSPEEQGMDSALLAQVFETIDRQNLEIDSVVVVRNGFIVAEKYYSPYTQDSRHVLYSCTKSFISALVGMAIEDGYIDNIHQPVLDFFPDRSFANLDERKESMTLEDLLTMRSGLDWQEGMPVYLEMERTTDWVAYVLDKPMAAEPGSQFRYCSGCSHLMSAILQETTGMNTIEYAQSLLFESMGISNFEWKLDGSGIANGGWGLEMTPRDMAKFGYLYLNNGTWDGQQIITAEWVKESTRAGLAAGGGVDYAYQWWVFPDSDMYAAQGLNGQKIYVVSDLELIIVFTADMVNTSPIQKLVEDWIIPAAQ
jgi:CubicO group peptidase (beta-lactamase class C family)